MPEMTDRTRDLMSECKTHAIRFGVPAHLTEGIAWYVYTGRPQGGFLTSVFVNNLRDSVMRADPASLTGLKALLQFMYNELPGPCHGSPAEVAAWIKKGGDPEWVTG